MDIAKTPIFLKIRLLDHWALSRISTKIKKNKTGTVIKVTWSKVLVLLARLYGITFIIC